MPNKTLSGLIAFLLILIHSTGLLAQNQNRDGWPSSFTVATASLGGTFYIYGSGWSNLVGEQLGINGAAEVTGGPVQNLALVHSNDLAFGMTTLGPAADALAGKSPLAPGFIMDNVCAMFPMYETPFSLTVLRNSGINTISDIPGNARIGFGPAGSTSDAYFPDMLKFLGVNFQKRNGGWDDLASQLKDGLIDVIAFAAGIPIPAVSQLEVQTNIHILEFTEAEQAKITGNFPVANFPIPARTYSSLETDARAVSMWNFFVANCDLPDSFVYELTRISMENNARMLTVHASASESIPSNYDKNKVLPFHPGAARWFNENGYPIPVDMIK
jgi:TRAP transporter TAXI family solute receptor